MLRPVKTLLYKPRNEEDIEEDILKTKKDDLKWKPVQFNYVENKMKGKFVICTNNSEYRLFPRQPSIMWRVLKAPPIGASWRVATDSENQYFSMSTLDGKTCKIKIKK